MLILKNRYRAVVFALIIISGFSAHAFTLFNGTEIDDENLPAPYQSGNGAAAEEWCKKQGKRLPTLDELKEMYYKRHEIGGFTDGFDAGGWPYWSERVTHNEDGRDYGYRIIFGKGADDYTQVSAHAYVKKFGDEGEIQYQPFWLKSGVGAYVRCVK